MAKFKKADETVTDLAKRLIKEHECYQPFTENKLRIDFLFAFPEYDEASGEPKSDAIRHGGRKALGLCRKVSLKDRVKGQGDAEICLDGDWWEDASEKDRAALLDHELYHIVITDKRDDLGRPILKLRKHDFEVGWFSTIAQRHGIHSQEQIQAKKVMDTYGQYFWPEMFAHNQQGSRTAKLELSTTR